MHGAVPIIAGAVAAGAVIAVIKYKSAVKEPQNIEKIYVDEVNLGELKSWFSGKLNEDGAKGLILRPTKENLQKFHIPLKESDHILVQAVYSVKKNEILAYREVSFSEIGNKLSTLLDADGGAFIVDK